MSRYAFIGILRCPYRKKCGPETADFDDETEEMERECFTRMHFGCSDYNLRRGYEEGKACFFGRIIIARDKLLWNLDGFFHNFRESRRRATSIPTS